MRRRSLIITFIILVVSAITIAFLAWQTRPQQKATESVQNHMYPSWWKTHVDHNNQWQIKVPKNYIESEDNATTIFTNSISSDDLNARYSDIIFFSRIYIIQRTLSANISLRDYVENLTQPQYNEGLGTMFAELYAIETFNIGNNNFIKARVGGDGCPTDAYFIQKNQNEYMRIDVVRCFDFREAVKDDALKIRLRSEIDLILSSLKLGSE